MNSDLYARWRYRLIPSHVIGELLSKNWVDSAVPFLILLLALVVFGSLVPNLLSLGNMSDLSRTAGEYLLIGIGLTIVVMAGGIDLSIGSVFALANLAALALGGYVGLPIWLAIAAVMAIGGLIGLINGVLIGYLKLRAFLTTLVTLIVVRAVVDTLLLSYSREIGGVDIQSPIWDFLAFGDVFGVSASFIVAVALAICAHLFLTRLRPGWHILAVGGSRRAAHNAGINVRRTVCSVRWRASSMRRGFPASATIPALASKSPCLPPSSWAARASAAGAARCSKPVSASSRSSSSPTA